MNKKKVYDRGIVYGVLSIFPWALIPMIGLSLSITGLITSITKSREYKTVLGIIFSSIGLACNIATFVISIILYF